MTKNTLQRRLAMAISRMIVDEWRLLSVRLSSDQGAVSERAVAFQLGWHLRPFLDRRWDVDCECNRSGAGDDVDRKRANSHLRLPDLIVHRRGGRTQEDNLLVLELKTNAGMQRHDGGSVETVRDLMQAHNYQYGVFLDLGISHAAEQTTVLPEWIWLEASIPTAPSVREPVYKQGENLDALIQRGLEEELCRYPIPSVSA